MYEHNRLKTGVRIFGTNMMSVFHTHLSMRFLTKSVGKGIFMATKAERRESGSSRPHLNAEHENVIRVGVVWFLLTLWEETPLSRLRNLATCVHALQTILHQITCSCSELTGSCPCDCIDPQFCRILRSLLVSVAPVPQQATLVGMCCRLFCPAKIIQIDHFHFKHVFISKS